MFINDKRLSNASFKEIMTKIAVMSLGSNFVEWVYKSKNHSFRFVEVKQRKPLYIRNTPFWLYWKFGVHLWWDDSIQLMKWRFILAPTQGVFILAQTQGVFILAQTHGIIENSLSSIFKRSDSLSLVSNSQIRML